MPTWTFKYKDQVLFLCKLWWSWSDTRYILAVLVCECFSQFGCFQNINMLAFSK